MRVRRLLNNSWIRRVVMLYVEFVAALPTVEPLLREDACDFNYVVEPENILRPGGSVSVGRVFLP
jgi:hypothetical protein